MNKNHQIQISENCPKNIIDSIRKYWEIQNNEFIHKRKDIALALGVTVHKVSMLVKENSKLNLETDCNECDNIIKHTVYSQSAFKQTVNGGYYCQTCMDVINENKRIEAKKLQIEQEKERQKLIDKLTEAIDNRHWSQLNLYEYKILYNIIHENSFNSFLKKYKHKSNHFWAAIFKLRDLNLIVLEQHSYGNSITGAQYLNQLKEELPEPKKAGESTMKEDVTFNKETNELKFKLTKNPNPYSYDSPEYSGTLEFNQNVVLKPGIEYSFGAWKRQNDVLYLTIIPTENKPQLPKQKNKAW